MVSFWILSYLMVSSLDSVISDGLLLDSVISDGLHGWDQLHIIMYKHIRSDSSAF